MITAIQIKEWRDLKSDGMTSAVGEYTPSEFWDALDEIERLRSALEWISQARTDEAWQLRDVADKALDGG